MSYDTKLRDKRSDSRPTQEYGLYQLAYDYCNTELFAACLPPCLITLQRHRGAYGYFWKQGFAARNNATLRTDEIALNPDTFAECTDKDILSTLVHEMTHLWQFHFGKPGRSGYHNRQWAREMLRVGLQPIEFDRHGNMTGKMTGQRVTHAIIPGGTFDHAVDRLLATGFCLRWQSAVVMVAHASGAAPAEVVGQKRNKLKFTCPECGQNVWGSRGTRVICGDCTNLKELKKYIPITWLERSTP